MPANQRTSGRSWAAPRRERTSRDRPARRGDRRRPVRSCNPCIRDHTPQPRTPRRPPGLHGLHRSPPPLERREPVLCKVPNPLCPLPWWRSTAKSRSFVETCAWSRSRIGTRAIESITVRRRHSAAFKSMPRDQESPTFHTCSSTRPGTRCHAKKVGRPIYPSACSGGGAQGGMRPGPNLTSLVAAALREKFSRW